MMPPPRAPSSFRSLTLWMSRQQGRPRWRQLLQPRECQATFLVFKRTVYAQSQPQPYQHQQQDVEPQPLFHYTEVSPRIGEGGKEGTAAILFLILGPSGFLPLRVVFLLHDGVGP